MNTQSVWDKNSKSGTGFSASSKGCATSSEDYVSLNGLTVVELQGKRVFVMTSPPEYGFEGLFLRTNVVVGAQDGETVEVLYATVELDDGSYKAFNFSRAVVGLVR